jgi:hypothetical protein
MGLFCGSSVFKKDGGKFGLLENNKYVCQSAERVPVFLAFDAMCRLTGLRGVVGKRPREEMEEDAKFYPSEIATALFAPLVEFVKCHPDTDVTIAVICDASTDVPIEKRATQIKRATSSSFHPYEIDTKTQHCEFVDAGLKVDDAPCMMIDMYSLMSTRTLRPYFYQYLRDWITKQVWAQKFTLIFDAEFPIGGHQAFTYAINPSCEVKEQSVPHSGTGEGEISAVVWGLRRKDTHFVQLHSGDLDMLGLTLIHGNKFKYDLKASLCGRYTISYREAVENLGKDGFLWQDVVLGAIMLGTDFVQKNLVTHRAGTEAVFEAARALRVIANTEDVIQIITNSDLFHLSSILTAANNVLKEEKKTKTGNVLQRITQWGGCVSKNRVTITEEGRSQVQFNLKYWFALNSSGIPEEPEEPEEPFTI